LLGGDRAAVKTVQDFLLAGKVDEAQKAFAKLGELDLDRNTAPRYRRLRTPVEAAAQK
jgi:hypothetical protein